ncbi:MAG: hypothetical protein AAF602_19565, partial [Myxococcota bacterium]
MRLLVILGSVACSLGNTVTASCVDDLQCSELFGEGSTCGVTGTCVGGTQVPTEPEPTPDPCPDATGPEVPYDGIDNDCDPDTRDDDLDRDGFVLASDCDDTDDRVYGGGSLTVDVEDADGLASVCDARCEAMTLLDGHITLTDAPETLDGLSCVSEVGGNVELRGSGVRSLSGLAHIVRIGGDLVVTSEPDLLGLQGLDALTE